MSSDDPEAKRARARRAKAVVAAATADGIASDVEVDRRKKSRNRRFVEAAEQAAEATAPTDHTLDIMDQAPVVVEMARSSMDPDWEDNPNNLDTSVEVRSELRDDGLDPMDVSTPQQASFGHSLVHQFANDRDLGGRTPEQLEAEHDMTVAAMREFGHKHDSPLSMGGITGDGGGADLEVEAPSIFGGDRE